MFSPKLPGPAYFGLEVPRSRCGSQVALGRFRTLRSTGGVASNSTCPFALYGDFGWCEDHLLH
eukprot:3412424-Amphidinium_carterae.1